MQTKPKYRYLIRKVKITPSALLDPLVLDSLALESGKLYSKTVVEFWRVVRKKNLWLKPSSMMRWINSHKVHTHTADATVQSFFFSLASWKTRKTLDPLAKPPKRQRRYFKVIWKSSAIRLKEGVLKLSNGRGNKPLEISWTHSLPVQVDLGWKDDGYVLTACYKTTALPTTTTGKVAGVDLGEKQLAAITDGETVKLFSGKLVRSKQRYLNKLTAKLQALASAKKKGSHTEKKLRSSFRKQKAKIKNQVSDVLHKLTTNIISTLKHMEVQTVVIGDVRDIRKNNDCGTKRNQQLHQFPYGKVRHMLTYKAENRGIAVSLQKEYNTSKACPVCSSLNTIKDRNYFCHCGFKSHRDGVGCFNIRKKYLGAIKEFPVVGLMASPLGVRFKPHLLCSY